MVRGNLESFVVTHCTGLGLQRIALAVLLVGVLGLAGCGRKGPLDAPPSAAAPAASAAPAPDGMAGEPTVGDEGQPVAPRGPKRRLPIDILLN
jgi:predicted small lipoprotein YifL